MKREYQEIIRTPLEDVMHDCFMPYAEYVILERALPRVEDGLKPVQRRILYAMYERQLFPDAKHKKCARIVGDTMGKYHPHGDTSIYNALARMAQDFSMQIPLVDGQGNFGSIDGDGPAAMRYTEARLAPIATEMLRDIDKETVPFNLTFDDDALEPTILPARYPNLLVNGATGIAVGLATNIPPHNLGETIDGVVYRIQHPDATLKEVMRRIKAPDFPTGGILMGGDGLEEAYRTGKGKVILRAKTELEQQKNGKTRIVITELPYEVRESALLKKIETLRETKKEMFSGIDQVRSETDRTGLRGVVELKRGVDAQKVLDCLFKYSDLQITYGINIVAIADGQPKQMGLLEVIDYYIAHQRRVLTNRVKYDIEKAEEREHKLAGLIIAVSNIDLVIKIIRSSKNSKEAKQRLMEQVFLCTHIAALDIGGRDSTKGQSLGGDMYRLTGIQAQAILDMRLARLTQLEIEALMEEYREIVELLRYLYEILNSPGKLDEVLTEEMTKIRGKYNVRRRTRLSGESGEVNIDQEHFKVVEECAVILTRAGNLKRMSLKALARGAEGTDVEERNLPQYTIHTNTDAKLKLFTNLGNLFTLPVSAVREAKYREAGGLIHTLLAGLASDEHILALLPDAQEEGELLTVTAQGMVKRTALAEFQTRKTRMLGCGLKDGDRLIYAQIASADTPQLLLLTKHGMSIRFPHGDISVQGRTAKGIGGIKLAAGDTVVLAAQTGEEGAVVVFTDGGYAKQTPLREYEIQGRNGKGLKTYLWSKDGMAGRAIVAGFYIPVEPAAFLLHTQAGTTREVSTMEIPKEKRYAKGLQVIPAMLGDAVDSVTRLR